LQENFSIISQLLKGKILSKEAVTVIPTGKKWL